MGVATALTSEVLIPALMDEVDELLKIYGEQAYQGLVKYLLVPVTIIATIYLAVQGIRLVLGQVELSMSAVVKALMRIGLIFTFMGSGGWGYISQYCYDFLNALSTKLGSVLIKSTSPLDLGDIFDGLQAVLNQFSDIGLDFFMQGHLYHPLPYLNGLIVWAVGFVITAVALFQIIMAKVIFSILIIILPVILILCFFEMFQPIFDRWLGFVLGIFLMQVLIYVVLAFEVTLSNWWVGSFAISSTTHLSNFTAIPIIILGVISIGLMGKVSALAYAIGSGVSSLSGHSGGGHWIGRSFWGRGRGGKSSGQQSQGSWKGRFENFSTSYQADSQSRKSYWNSLNSKGGHPL